MTEKIKKIFVYCSAFLICSIIGYLIYPFYNLLSIYIVLVLMVYLCSVFSTDKMRFQKYAIILLILFFVGHIMGLGAALVWSIYVLMEYDFSYLRSSHGHEYPLMMLVTTLAIFCFTSLYTFYYNCNNVDPSGKKEMNKSKNKTDCCLKNCLLKDSDEIRRESDDNLIDKEEYVEILNNSNASLLSSNIRTTTV